MEKVVLVGLALKGKADAMEESLAELGRLTETAGGTVVERVTQRVERKNPRLLIGEGKAHEVASLARKHRARTVIFDEDLAPAQQKALEDIVGAKVLDRTRLILDIFAKRARTKEGELQVELAQLSYMLPRLTGAWRGFSQQVGGIGTRGPGERKLEYERRHIRRRIEYLKRDIARMRHERDVQRQRRRSVPVPHVALIGYTNVGKSSLLNALLENSGATTSTVYADDKLFATLDPTTRRVRLPQGGWAVVTDTVGFIQKLPTDLVAAFRSTLEEVAEADCLVHVRDATARDESRQTAAVTAVLDDLGANEVPCIVAYNKTDSLGAPEVRALASAHPEAAMISARSGAGLPDLMRLVEAALASRWMLRDLDLDPARAARLSEIYASSQVLDQKAVDGKIRLRLRVTQENWARLLNKLK
ncbi:MAG: GTPase HflX [Elusimicrobia bacterium]|nr:GTPase HflX [Elusimicrobiota bacterium]